jgi:hypothetical protein
MMRQSVLAIIFALLAGLAAGAPQKAKPAQAEKKGSRKEQTVQKGSVDINNANERELDALPGVGSATAKKIIDHRPYRSVDDLAKAGVTAKQIEGIRSLVVVGNAPSNSVERPSIPPSTAAPTPVSPATPPRTAQSPSGNASTPPAGSGMVWVNTATKVYHKEGDRYYGKTKQGKYMSEADAIREGNRAAKR